MGLEFIRDKKADFDQKVDESRSKELDVDLLTGAYADDEVQLIRCQLIVDDVVLTSGGFRLIIRLFSETEAVVQYSARNIGTVSATDTLRLAELMKANKIHTGILPVLVVEAPDISGEFLVKPTKPLKH